MKVKELERFAHCAWSPASCDSTVLATVTAEDDSFTLSGTCKSVPPVLELFRIRFDDTQLDIPSIASINVETRSTCLCWSQPTSGAELGFLVSGTSSGDLVLYSPDILLSASDDSDFDLLSKLTIASKVQAHSGIVRGLDANHFQTNLFASASDESEIYIWDVEKFDQPMSPGNKIQPPELISTVAWNPHVQHILATTCAGHCTIWDLRRSDPVVHLTKSMCQFEPHLMAWSPDVATRLCLADPSHPTADVLLWDLRHPKHMLALLGRWPPSSCGSLDQAALGNAGTVNALAWSPASFSGRQRKRGPSLHDPDLVAVSITASGALPTPEGGLGTGLEPASGDFLVVWSVSEALKSTQLETTGTVVSRQPVFVGRLEGSSLDDASSSVVLGALPTNSSVHWLPTQPGLVGITQSDGWISVINLMSGVDKPSAGNYARLTRSLRSTHLSTSRHASHKVAEAFGEEVDLSDFSTKDNNDSFTQLTEEVVLSDPALINWEKSTVQPSDAKKMQSFPQLPQPMPCLRIAPRWLKRPIGANFSFGGRLVWFTANSCDYSLRTRSASSQSGVALGQTSDSSALSAANTIGELVHLDWIYTAHDVHIPGIKASIGQTMDVRQSLLTWLRDAVDLPVSELDDLCSHLDASLEPSSIDCNGCRIYPWKLLRGRIQSTDQLVSAISDQLGFNSQSIRTQVENILMAQPTLTEAQEDLHSQAVATLSVLKMTLVIADLPSSIRLCTHSTLAALNCKNISPLSAMAIVLSLLIGEDKLRSETHSSILSALTQAASSTEPALHSITLILSGLILGDWVNVLTSWPLTDWVTALATLVNHMMLQDASVFRNLCGVLISRCLNFSEHCELSPMDRYLAAWTCAMLCCDLDAIIQSWYGIHSLVDMELQGDQLLPLAIQLILLSKCIDESVGLIPSVSKLFSTLATWLGQIRSGLSEEDALLALQILCRFTSNSQSVSHSAESDELTHRLWCGLSDMNRQQLIHQFGKLKLSCPFERSQAFIDRQCDSTSTAVTAASALHFHATNAIPAIPATHPISSLTTGSFTTNYSSISRPTSTVPLNPSEYLASSASSAILETTPGLSQRTPFVPMYTPETSAGGLTFSTGPPAGDVHAAAVSRFPHAVPSHPSKVLPGPPQNASILQFSTVAAPRAVTSPPVDPRFNELNIFASTCPSTNPAGIPTSNTHMSPQTVPQGFISGPVSSHPSPPYTSRSWNDPPLLAPTYHPIRPVVLHNNFYDPTQFTTVATQPPTPSALHTMEPHPHPSFVSPPVAPNTLGAPLTNGIRPPLVETLHTVNQPRFHYPAPPSSAYLSPPSSIVQPPAAPPPNKQAPIGFGNEGLNYPVNRFIPTTHSPSTSGMPDSGLNFTHWPAAQPLGTASLAGSAHSCSTHDKAAHDVSSPVSSDETSYTTVPSEFTAIESELTRLVQLCRTVGGKSFAAKMDTVERRLSALFAIFHRWSSEGPVLSDIVLSHLKDCVFAASQSDFVKAVEHANLLIQSASGFESIHGFAPGLKILMQSARQLFPSTSTSSHPHSTQAQCTVHSTT